MLLDHELQGASPDRCFFCGEVAPEGGITREHVFPKWLQHQHTLWDKRLVLVNGTEIPYRRLTVPACARCNNVVLSRLENEVAQAQQGGADKVRALGHEKLFVWMAKIFFGILYAEALLPSDRAVPESAPIIPEAVLLGFDRLHFLMQAARARYTFEGGPSKYHSSILVFPIQEHPDPSARFMFRDDIPMGCVALRFGRVGIIYIPDGGAQEVVADDIFSKLYEMALHPIQFEELTARTFTKHASFNRNPLYITTQTPDGLSMMQMPLGGLSNKPIWDEFDDRLFAHVLASFLNAPVDVINPEPGKIATWIGDYRNPTQIDVTTHPFG